MGSPSTPDPLEHCCVTNLLKASFDWMSKRLMERLVPVSCTLGVVRSAHRVSCPLEPALQFVR